MRSSNLKGGVLPQWLSAAGRGVTPSGVMTNAIPSLYGWYLMCRRIDMDYRVGCRTAFRAYVHRPRRYRWLQVLEKLESKAAITPGRSAKSSGLLKLQRRGARSRAVERAIPAGRGWWSVGSPRARGPTGPHHPLCYTGVSAARKASERMRPLVVRRWYGLLRARRAYTRVAVVLASCGRSRLNAAVTYWGVQGAHLQESRDHSIDRRGTECEGP
ncbi:hypothetical protein C8Q78DRAFT_450564 [Trametes maxima]|nr:hypothetical protein C8Q78DRAFT_450564 [Trametes maxima]